MKRFLITTFLLLSASLVLAAPPAKTPAKRVAAQPPVPSVAPAPPGAPAEAPIPFAPLGPPPFGDAPQQPAAPNLTGAAVSVFFEEGAMRFLVFDERGWLPDVKQLQMSVSVGARSLELVSYPGPYAPTLPEVRKCDLAKITTLTPAEFQAKLDEVSRGAAQQNGVASR